LREAKESISATEGVVPEDPVIIASSRNEELDGLLAFLVGEGRAEKDNIPIVVINPTLLVSTFL
jgi:hypothetical protein